MQRRSICVLVMLIGLPSLVLPARLKAQPGAAQRSPLAVEPSTPQEYVDSILLLNRIGRPELARDYLERLLSLPLDEQTLLDLRDRHGTATFLELSRQESLRPASSDLLQRITTAALNRINDPATLQEVLRRLSGTAREQQQAIMELRFFGSAVVPTILTRIRLPQPGDNPDQLANALVLLGPVASSPLVAALGTSDADHQGLLLGILGHIGGERALPYLWSYAFSARRPDAVRTAARLAIARIEYGDPLAAVRVNEFGVVERLEHLVLQHLHDEVFWDTDDEGLVEFWFHDSASDLPVMQRVTPRSASLFTAEWLARDAFLIEPTRQDLQVLFMAVMLEHEVYLSGWNQPVPEGPGTAHEMAVLAGSDLCEQVVSLALREGLHGAAVSAVNALGQNGTADLLAGDGSATSALVQALNAPEPRIQFAAAEAVMRLQPRHVFPHAGRVVEIFARVLSAGGQLQTVVIDPNEQRGGRMAGMLANLGYRPTLTPTGQEGFEHAAEHGDVALAVIHLNAVGWELTQTVANLRADARTASIPIAIYGPQGLEARAELLMQRFPRTFYLYEAHEPRLIRDQLSPVLKTVSPPMLTPEQLQQQKQVAAFWLRQMALSGRHDLFSLVPAEEALAHALLDPNLAAHAMTAYASIGRPTVQSYLLDLATAPSSDLPLRQRAALHLAMNLQHYGTLLTSTELQKLQQAHAQEADPGVRSFLSAAMGTIPRSTEGLVPLLERHRGPTSPGR